MAGQTHPVSLNSEASQKKTLSTPKWIVGVKRKHSGLSDGISGTCHNKRSVPITSTALFL
jgi:hypothetical protein